MDFSFRTDYNFLFIPAIALIAAVISYYYYKRSRLEGVSKKLFIVLRFLSLFFILLLLSSPVISFFGKSSGDAINVFLIDNSRSLIIDNREELLKEMLKDKISGTEPSNSKNLYYLFSGNLYKEISSGDFESIIYEGFNNFETDMSTTLYSLEERLANKNLSSITFISDGIINQGGNPVTAARSFNVPVNYIIIGDTLQKKDLLVRDVFYNKTAFIESSVPLNVEINSYGFDRDIQVELFEENNLIDSRTMKVNSGQSIYNVGFKVISPVEKITKYRVEVKGADGEITLMNNFREFFIKFTDNKFKLLVLAGGPSSDVAFITDEIRKIKNFEAEFRVQKSATEYYEGPLPSVQGFDSYVLIGFPSAVTGQNIMNEIKDAVEKNNASVIFFASRTTDYRKLMTLEDRLPFRFSSVSESESLTGIRTVGSISDEVFKNSNLLTSINSFPNIFKTSAVFTINSSAETFLVMNQNSEPAFVIENTGKNKSAAFLAYGLYKWKLNNFRNNAEEVFNYLIASSVAGITNKEGKKLFNVNTTKPVYSKYENVKFEARITNYEMQGGEEIKIKIKSAGYDSELILTKKENRYYEGEINIPTDGNYEYTAEFHSKNGLVESIQNRFAIGENNFEYLLTRSGNTILNILANESGGLNFTNRSPGEIKEKISELNDKSRTQVRSREKFELNLNPYYLAIVIFLLCLEWFFRKRNSLP